MATEREEIIYTVKLDIEATNSALKQYGAALTEIQKTQASMNQTTKEQEELISRQEKAAAKTKQAIDAEAGSIAALREQNKRLTAERNSVSLATEEGRKKVEAINKQLDNNNKLIKENVDSYTKQKIGVGDYTGALDKLVPGLGATASGFMANTKAALAFVATPVGAILGVIGAGLGALISYFKGSEEGQNRLNKIMNIGGAIMEKITDVIELLGGKLFDVLGSALTFVTGAFDKLATAVGINTEGIKTFFREVDQMAEVYATNERRRNEQLRELTVLRAKTAMEVADLILKAQEQEGEARLKTVNQAIALKKVLLDKELEHVQTLKALADQRAKDDPTIENLQDQAEAEAALFQQRASYSEEIKKLNAQRVKEEQDLAEQKRLSDSDRYQSDASKVVETEGIKQVAIQQTDFLKIRSNEEEKKRLDELLKKKIAATKKEQDVANESQKTQTRIAQLESSNRLASISSTLGQAQALFKKDTVGYKIMGIARATMDTYRAADLALATYPPPFGAIAAGVSIATGLANVAQIQGVQGFARGGRPLSGTKIKSHHGIPISRNNGDNLLATVKTGEVILNEEHQARLGGASTFKRIGVPGFASSGVTGGLNAAQDIETRMAASAFESSSATRDMLDILRQQRTVLVLQDFEAKQNDRDQTQVRAQVL